MQTATFAQRARSYFQPKALDSTDFGNEINERNEIIPSSPVAAQGTTSPELEDERNELNEIIPLPTLPAPPAPPPPMPPPPPAVIVEFAPLSGSIIRGLGRKHTIAEIQERIDHSRLTAAQFPDAPVYARAVLNWLEILAAKERGTVLDDSEPSEHDDDEPWLGAEVS